MAILFSQDAELIDMRDRRLNLKTPYQTESIQTRNYTNFSRNRSAVTPAAALQLTSLDAMACKQADWWCMYYWLLNCLMFLCAQSCKEMYRLSNELFGNQQPPIYPYFLFMLTCHNCPIFFLKCSRRSWKIFLSLESECHDASTFDDPVSNGLPLDQFQCISGNDIKKLISNSAKK